ncbi:MAG: PAS domain S-box protein [Candidatus Sumerlaeaceae bacterium]|nr:PAS domain S-box protein [Candidatus Sumerlaeaceae bacterium]
MAQVFSPGLADAVVHHAGEMRKSGLPRRFEITLRGDGPEVTLEVTLAQCGEDLLVLLTDIGVDRQEHALNAALKRLSQQLTEKIGIDALARLVACEARTLFHFDAFSFDLVEEENRVLRGVLYQDTPQGTCSPVDFPVDQGAPCLLERGRALSESPRLIDRSVEGSDARLHPFGTSRKSESIMISPIAYKGRTIAVVTVHSYTRHAFNLNQLNAFTLLVGQCGAAVERVLAEKALRNSEELFRALTSCMPTGLFYDNADGENIYLNPECEKQCGFESSRFHGWDWAQYVHPEDSNRIVTRWRQCVTHSLPFREEFRFVLPGGEIRWVDVRTAPIRNESGATVGHVGTLLNITPTRSASDKLTQSLDHLRQLKLRYEAVLRSTPSGLCMISSDWMILFANASMRSILIGTVDSQTDPAGMSLRSLFVTESDFHSFTREVNSAIRRHGAFRSEMPLRRLSDAQFWADVSVVTLDPTGSNPGYVATISDITERHIADHARSRAEKRESLLRRLAVELSGTRTLDHVGGILRDTTERLWNWDAFYLTSCCDASGRWRSVCIVDTIKHVKVEFPPQDHQEAPKFDRQIRLGRPIVINRRVGGEGPQLSSFGNLDQRSASLVFAPIRVEQSVIGYLSIQSYKPGRFSEADSELLMAIADASAPAIQRVRLETEMARLAQAAEQTAEGLLILDTDWKIIYANPAFTAMTGYTREEAVGCGPRQLLGSDVYDDQFYEDVRARLDRGNSVHGEFSGRRKDGSEFQCRVTISPVRDPSGNIINYMFAGHDITQERVLQAELLQSQKMETIGILAGGIAHDFNNQLQIISGWTQVLLDRQPPDGPDRQELEAIFKAARGGSNLVRQLLAFTRKQVLKPQFVDLKAVVAGFGRMLRHLLREDIEVKTSVAEDLWIIHADPGQIEQVILNLAVNARDAMPAGGRLYITLENRAAPRESDSSKGTSFQSDHVALIVEDTGCGMDEGIRRRIFEPFFTTKEVGKGTGLGLSTVYGIVTQSGGAIEVESTPGIGSRFTVLLPRVEPPLPTADADAPQELLARGHETILIAEDDDEVRVLTRCNLERLGYRVLEAADGRQALDLSDHYCGAIDLLLADVFMPGMGARELIPEIRKHRSGLPVLLMSAHAEPHWAKADSDEHFDLIRKPYDNQTLARKVRAALDHATSIPARV